ncbi:hypothetical protein FB567DRAFT_532032 [Paraphoma chrysanthemicola]|uniref:Uncharacterized protein n=1 Tax=Paraphoma chrysanthemicola TaxID=798071 RepID=A0A8K0VWB1_9PLEO|nr:hypothetical protein FB567DRAFT_532032 [Paraphoma chrysanthemicola]
MLSGTRSTRTKFPATLRQLPNKPAISQIQDIILTLIPIRQNRSEMTNSIEAAGDTVSAANSGFLNDGTAPGERFEPRQTATSES